MSAQIKKRLRELNHNYDLICEKIPAFKEFSLEQYQQAMMMASSRAFQFTMDGQETLGLVPYADMFNHKRPKQTNWFFDQEKKGFVVEATENIAKGE